MELTIEEAFRRGDQAYKEGNINEADKFFSAVLGAFPEHPLHQQRDGVAAGTQYVVVFMSGGQTYT